MIGKTGFCAAKAAREIGVNERTIRRAIQDGRLPARKVNARRYEVDIDDARRACLGPLSAALHEALETLQEVGFGRDADEIRNRYGV